MATMITSMHVIQKLIENGWIPLRQLGVLLGKPNRSIYGRKRTKNPVETIRIGGIERVYLESVQTELKAGDHTVILQVIETALHSKKRKEKEDA